jgi:sugar diacid utilization regulator
LHVHTNALRYRMQRIVELTSLDPDVRLVLELQLHLDGGNEAAE